MNYLKLIAIAALLPCSAIGGVISFSSVAGSGIASEEWIVTDSSGDALASGIAAVGYFSTLEDGVVGSEDFVTLSSDFVTLGADDFDAFVQANAGRQEDGITGGFVDYGLINGSSALAGKTIYVFIGNSATISGSTEFAILNSGLAMDVDSSSAPPGDDNTFIFAGTSVVFGSQGVGSFNGTGISGNNPQDATTLQLVAVPEPSAALLGALGALALLRRRRVA